MSTDCGPPRPDDHVETARGFTTVLRCLRPAGGGVFLILDIGREVYLVERHAPLDDARSRAWRHLDAGVVSGSAPEPRLCDPVTDTQ